MLTKFSANNLLNIECHSIKTTIFAPLLICNSMTQTQNNPKIGEQTAKEKVAVHHLLGCLGTALFIVILIVALLVWVLI